MSIVGHLSFNHWKYGDKGLRKTQTLKYFYLVLIEGIGRIGTETYAEVTRCKLA